MKKYLKNLILFGSIIGIGYLIYANLDKIRRGVDELGGKVKKFAEENYSDTIDSLGKAVNQVKDEFVQLVKDHESLAPIVKNLERYSENQISKNFENKGYIEQTGELPVAKNRDMNGKINLNDRQKELLDFVRVYDKVSMGEISEKFDYVSQRTLRRDMDKLQSLGVVNQQGKTRDSVYIVNY